MSSVESEYKVVLRWKSKCSFSQGTEAKVAKDELSCLAQNTGKEDETDIKYIRRCFLSKESGL